MQEVHFFFSFLHSLQWFRLSFIILHLNLLLLELIPDYAVSYAEKSLVSFPDTNLTYIY